MQVGVAEDFFFHQKCCSLKAIKGRLCPRELAWPHSTCFWSSPRDGTVQAGRAAQCSCCSACTMDTAILQGFFSPSQQGLHTPACCASQEPAPSPGVSTEVLRQPRAVGPLVRSPLAQDEQCFTEPVPPWHPNRGQASAAAGLSSSWYAL